MKLCYGFAACFLYRIGNADYTYDLTVFNDAHGCLTLGGKGSGIGFKWIEHCGFGCQPAASYQDIAAVDPA